MTTYDGVLYQDQIAEIQFQILGQAETTTMGSICFDHLTSYDDEEVVVSTEAPPIASKLLLFPNPTSDKLTISGIENAELIQIYGMNGQLVQQLRNNALSSIDVSALHSGFYVIKVYSQQNVYTGKFMKQ